VAKTCPQCNTEFADALDFCPRDGAILGADDRRFTETMVGPEGLAAALRLAAAPASTLADLLPRAPLTTEVAVERVAEICDVLAADHSGPHGGLTPAHVRYPQREFRGRPTIAGVHELTLEPRTAAGYRAPECADGPATAAADVYALACVLFELLTGRPPFTGATAEDIAKRHATAAAPPVRMVKRDSDLPPSLDLELQRALKKRPGDRHASVRAFADAIRATQRDDDRATMALGAGDIAKVQALLAEQAAARVQVSASSAPASPPPASAPPPNAPPASEPATEASDTPHPVKAGRVPVGALVMGAVALLAAIAAGLWFLRAPPPPPPLPVQQPAPPAPPPPAPDVMQAPEVVETPDAGAEEDVPPAKPERKPRKVPAKSGKPADTPSPKKMDGPITF
jgi:serine/threonine-protein kinase